MVATLKKLPRETPVPRGVDAVYTVALRNCHSAALDELMALSSQAVQRCVYAWVWVWFCGHVGVHGWLGVAARYAMTDHDAAPSSSVHWCKGQRQPHELARACVRADVRACSSNQTNVFGHSRRLDELPKPS
eukprot:scaffold131743_cov22-Tisochrysis_lutea.AAC.1